MIVSVQTELLSCLVGTVNITAFRNSEPRPIFGVDPTDRVFKYRTMFARVFVFLLLTVGACRSELIWEKQVQDFQRRPEDQELSVKFSFRNNGRDPVTIIKVTSSCGCTTAELPKKTFDAGESGTLTAKFVFGERRGAQTKTISVTTSDHRTSQLTLNCLISNDPLALAPSFVFWRIGEEPAAKEVMLNVAPNVPLRVTSVASSNARVSAELSSQKPGEDYRVTIRPADTSRQESAEVFVQTNFPTEGPKAYSIHVRVK